jgi:NADH-quinone oxidoreductase subunit L
MEAPAPASALIHSATLVSAGLFIVLKFYIFYKLSPYFSLTVAVVGAITSLFGSIVSLTQSDLKRVLAYSTISNCGLLFVSSMLTTHTNTLLLFQFHGLLKSLAFLFVGFIILILTHNQDYRLLGSTTYNIKFILLGFNIIMCCLSG